MSDKEKNETQAPKTNCDLRTFLIALLTSVIVVAVYHIGVTCCKYFCCDAETCITPRYMLVPVVNVQPPCPGMPCHGKPGPEMRHHKMRGKHGMRQGCPMPGRPGCPMMDEPGYPGKPLPPPAKPAEAAKAAKAAKAPVAK